jgi:hypothetical protein
MSIPWGAGQKRAYFFVIETRRDQKCKKTPLYILYTYSTVSMALCRSNFTQALVGQAVEMILLRESEGLDHYWFLTGDEKSCKSKKSKIQT